MPAAGLAGEEHRGDPGPADALTEVPVHAAVLDATADLLGLLSDFFTSTDPATRSRLGCFLVER